MRLVGIWIIKCELIDILGNHIAQIISSYVSGSFLDKIPLLMIPKMVCMVMVQQFLNLPMALCCLPILLDYLKIEGPMLIILFSFGRMRA